MVLKNEGRAGGLLFLILIFFIHYLYKIRTHQDWPWQANCLVYHRTAENTGMGLKTGKNSFYCFAIIKWNSLHDLEYQINVKNFLESLKIVKNEI